MSTATLPPDLDAKRAALLEWFNDLRTCVVAFSGGVDSAVVAKAAHLVLGDQALAVTADSPSVASGEVEAAVALAVLIGIPHQVVRTSEIDDPAYRQNSADRCYHCKSTLYDRLGELSQALAAAGQPEALILSGSNLDDLGDYRPGLSAARERGVRSPLVDCRLTKSDVRALASHWLLPVSDKPATPCLSSRIAYGLEVTPERLARIDRAEQFLRSHGFVEFRVRCHPGELARIELSPSDLPRFLSSNLPTLTSTHFSSLGFLFTTLDLTGFRSGSLNTLLPILP